MNKKFSNAAQYAFHDISKWLGEKGINRTGFHDIWIVTPSNLDSPHQRRLNRQLGIDKMNYHAGNMSRPQKKSSE